MQSNENILTNTKSFPEIWQTLSSDEKDNLCILIFQRKCCKSRQAIRQWGAGNRTPRNPIVRDAIAIAVSKAIGQKCYSHTLFPNA